MGERKSPCSIIIDHWFGKHSTTDERHPVTDATAVATEPPGDILAYFSTKNTFFIVVN